MKLRAAYLCLSVFICAVAHAAAPTTQPGVGVVVPSGITRPVIQAKLGDAAARGLPVTLDAGTYRIDKPLMLPRDTRLRGNGGVMLVGTAPGPIVVVGENCTVEGVAFSASVAGVTGIAGNFVRVRVRDCDFVTSLAIGIDAHGLLSRITDCRFGLAGDWPKAFQAIRIRGDGSTNAWEIDHVAVYHCVGDVAVEVGDGCGLDLHHANLEQNRTRVAVRVAGMSNVRIENNWVEANDGESQIELAHDRSDTIGNYTVTSTNNYFVLSGDGNKQVYNTAAGACRIVSVNDAGTNFAGKAFASGMEAVDLGRHWFIGWNHSDGNGP